VPFIIPFQLFLWQISVMKKNIAVVMGGYTSEYSISLISGSVVVKHLDKNKYDVYPVIMEQNGWKVVLGQEEFPMDKTDFSAVIHGKKITFDCVFNAIHGSPGEDGLLQGYLQMIGVPQTACDPYQAALTYNKRDLLAITKTMGIPCAASYMLNEGDPIDVAAIEQAVGFPCFVKANKSGSSFGITKVYQKEDLPKAVEIAYQEDNEVLIEAALVGTEVSVGVIKFQGETKVLPITEIISENDFFDYEAKYLGKSQEITPARITDVQQKNVTSIAAKLYDRLKLKGFTRSEFIFVGDIPHLLEVNTTPGMTEQSLLPMQAKAAGISLEALFDSAIKNALNP